jgi:hypothetical protein
VTFAPTKPRDPGTTKAVVSTLVGEAGGMKRVAFLLGRHERTVHAYSDPDQDKAISFDCVRRLTLSTGACAAAEDLAALAGGVFVPCAKGRETFDALTARSARDWGQYIALVLSAHAKGTLAELEPQIRKELDDVIRALACARAKLIATEHTP